MAAKLSLSASAADRWLTCKASPRFLVDNDHLLDKTPRDYTDAGTIAHAWAEKILKREAKVEDIPDKTMRDNVGGYVEFCRDKSSKDAEEIGIEEAVELFYMPGRRGIIDYSIVRPNSDLYIIDYKNGHTPVEATGNSQLAIYALSKLKKMRSSGQQMAGDPLITIVIYQPNTPGPAEDIWAVRESELQDFRDEVLLVADEILLADADEELPFAPSEKACMWCLAAAFCPARGGNALAMVPDMTIENADSLPLPRPETLTPEQLVQFKVRSKEFKKWMCDIDSHIDRLMLVEGQRIAGLKVCMGREGNREWVSEEEAQKLLYPKLVADSYKPKELISVTQAEKLLKEKEVKLSTRFKNRFAELVFRSPAKKVVALESDKRPAVEDTLKNTVPDLLDIEVKAMLE